MTCFFLHSAYLRLGWFAAKVMPYISASVGKRSKINAAVDE